MSAPLPRPLPDAVRGPIRTGVVALVLFMAGFLGWGVLVPIGGAVIAPGQIEVERNRQVVQHPEGGRIAAILVAEGDHVRAGQVLVRLDSADDRAALALAEDLLARHLAERGRLEAERDGDDAPRFPPGLAALAAARPGLAALAAQERALLAARRSARAAELAALDLQRRDARAEIGGIDAEAGAAGRQRRLLQDELARQTGLLAQGLAQAGRVADIEREIARIDGQAGALQADRARARGRIAEADLQALRLARATRDEALARLRDLGAAEAELAERCARLRARIAAADLRAPLDGTVLGLQFTSPAAVVRPAEPILSLLPDGRPLMVEARISPADIDQVAVGQPARLRVTAFDSRSTADLAGRVARLSADVMTDPARGTAYYRAEIELAPTGTPRLIPGMPVEVFLATGRRTALRLVTEPLTRYFGRALRAG
ncbi:MAG: HlyD family type I secretion periplasmic adaptor subunit [Proteobacteria bacterium]|nr:HlyD family type I secretion periplasmic adaptor subunit [Pseudomonadota bacterium]MBS0571787.1 HlyD family type I secretion periplasmic adaptor subunit [Pseudomonadota bacterium]